jgi:hypothetical protein
VPYTDSHRPKVAEHSLPEGRTIAWRSVCSSPQRRRLWLDTAIAATQLLGQLGGLRCTHPCEQLEALDTLVESLEPCASATPAGIDSMDPVLGAAVGSLGAAAAAALLKMGRANAQLLEAMARLPDVPLVHMLLSTVQRAALAPAAAIPFQMEAAVLVLPALELLALAGNARPIEVAAAAEPEGAKLLVRLLDTKRWYSGAAAAQTEGSLHASQRWRWSVAAAARQVLAMLVLGDGFRGDALRPVLGAVGQEIESLAVTHRDALATARAEGGSVAAAAAQVIFEVCVGTSGFEPTDPQRTSWHVHGKPAKEAGRVHQNNGVGQLLDALCEHATPGGAEHAGRQGRRWGLAATGVRRRRWLQEWSCGSDGVLGRCAHAALYRLLCAAAVEYDCYAQGVTAVHAVGARHGRASDAGKVAKARVAEMTQRLARVDRLCRRVARVVRSWPVDGVEQQQLHSTRLARSRAQAAMAHLETQLDTQLGPRTQSKRAPPLNALVDTHTRKSASWAFGPPPVPVAATGLERWQDTHFLLLRSLVRQHHAQHGASMLRGIVAELANQEGVDMVDRAQLHSRLQHFGFDLSEDRCKPLFSAMEQQAGYVDFATVVVELDRHVSVTLVSLTASPRSC